MRIICHAKIIAQSVQNFFKRTQTNNIGYKELLIPFFYIEGEFISSLIYFKVQFCL